MKKLCGVKLTLTAITVMSLASAAISSDICLFKDGAPAAKIVTAEKPSRSAQLAVKELNHYMKKICGSELSVVTDKEADEKDALVLAGLSKLTDKVGLKKSDFKEQDYLIKTDKNRLILAGYDDDESGPVDYEGTGLWSGWGNDGWFLKHIGSVYAVHDFLKRYCGVRWYMPTEAGEVVPSKNTLEFSGLDLKRSPVMKHREFSEWAMELPEKLYIDANSKESPDKTKKLSVREKNLFYLRHKAGGEGFNSNHSFVSWQKRFEKTHPEYGALQPDGSRSFKQFCYMSDAVQNQILEDLRERIKNEQKNPLANPYGRKMFVPIMPNDYRDWCVCEKCRKYFDPARAMDFKKHFSNGCASNYVWTFIRDISRKIKEIAPDKIVTCSAYWDYYLPPDIPGFKLGDNVAVQLCRTNTTQYGPLFSPNGYRKDDMLKWKDISPALYSWEYLAFPQYKKDNMFPAVTPHRIARAMKFNHELGVRGVFLFYTEGFPSLYKYPAMEHLNNYAAMTMADDPGQDIDRLLAEYYTLFYGPAAEPVRLFNERMERIFESGGELAKAAAEGGANNTKNDAEYCWTKLCPPGEIREFGKLMDDAKKLAAEEPYKSRVDLMDKSLFQFMAANSKNILACKNIKSIAASRKTPGVKIDDGIKNPEWDKAIPISVFFNKSQAFVEKENEARLLNDDQNLYILFKCAQNERTTCAAQKRDGTVWMDDSLEIFIDSKDGSPHRQFVINADGVILDAKGRDSKWDSRIKAVTGKTDDGWYVIAAIPFSDLSSKENPAPAADETWGLNLIRNRVAFKDSANGAVSWAPLLMNDYHQPEKFGKLIFTK